MMSGVILDDNMSNLTSASNETISLTSSSRNEVGTAAYPQQHSLVSPNQPPPAKKKRNLPGNPDPDAEVVALSPKTLMATNRFICEICNKGFQRDQNLQLHRRGHNLPWKLKQRTNKEVKKKVYVCPEPSCVHHDPSRALGDLTGIKKHFSRKHGEKKWKCEKCSKRYAVQSDWKAHSKICGTREYRCDCGTLFSRRDSFITHRAFCDALAEESARSISITPSNPLLQNPSTSNPPPFFNLQNPSSFLQSLPLKREQDHLPPWLADADLSTQQHQLFSHHHPSFQNPNPSLLLSPSPQMSATALLQKAAQMGVTMSSPTGSVSAPLAASAPGSAGLCLLSSSRDGLGFGLGGKAGVTPSWMDPMGATGAPNPLLIQNNMMGFEGSSFEDALCGVLNPKMVDGHDFHALQAHLSRNDGGSGHGNDGLTRDFLGL
ncbi:hypothetical protein NMG60_11000756 [Bertholletia excelsa]